MNESIHERFDKIESQIRKLEDLFMEMRLQYPEFSKIEEKLSLENENIADGGK